MNTQSWNLYIRAFDYIRPEIRLIVIGFIISVVLGATSGLATYSFFPVLELVFGDGGTSSVSDASLSLLPESLRFDSFVLYRLIAGIGTEMSQLIRLTGFIIFLSIASTGLRLVVDYLFAWIQARGNERLRRDMFTHVTQLPMQYFVTTRSGETLSRLTNDIGGTIGMVTQSISHIIVSGLLTLVFGVILISLHPTLTLIALPVLVVGVIGTIGVGRWAHRNRRKILLLNSDIFAHIQEFLAGIKIIKSLSAESHERSRWNRTAARWRDLEVQNTLVKIYPIRFTEALVVAMSALIILIGGRFILNGSLTMPELILFFVLLARFQISASSLSRVWFQIQDGMAFAERTFQFLGINKEKRSGSKEIGVHAASISFDHVSFDYGDKTILHDISFSLLEDKITAVVGPSGSGKSTLVDLLLGLYEPVSGSIRLNGLPISHYQYVDYLSLFGVVTQDTFLFHDTVYNNVIYAVKHPVDRNSVIETCIAAHAHEFIAQLPQGYDTIIGDRGMRMSGGQRQRIALARAIVRNPRVLILDEATSSLDSRSEKEVQHAVNGLIERRTTLVIAHRLSTITKADQILVLNEGRIVERGQHKDLLEGKGLYHHLWMLQTGTYAEASIF